MSLLLPIPSPPHISTSLLSPPTFPLHPHPSFLYDHPQPLPTTTTHYRGRERLRPASIMKNPHGFLRKYFCSSFRGERGAEDFGSGAEDEEEEEEEEESNIDEEEVEVETEENWNFGSCHLPDRWDVLGLGQAMVTFYFMGFSFLG
jgi:hypothetical protein